MSNVVRCAIYTRTATCNPDAIRDQRSAAEQLIASRAERDWSALPQRFDDDGVSGATLERPALQALLDLIAARQVDLVVIHRFDRPSRKAEGLARLLREFSDRGVSVVSCSEAIDGTTPDGQLALILISSIREFEADIRRRPSA